jgi:tRNA-splicing ligase RtcB
MRKIIETEGKPIKLWLDEIEDGALKQAMNLANLPFLYKHVALMPDSHQGFGMPIGGVIATEGVIIPNAVGVDIGCGMCAVKTSLTEVDRETIKRILTGIRDRVPLGFNHHRRAQDESLMPDKSRIVHNSIVEREYKAALKQIGTLGGGNHFIEIQRGSDGFIWIMVHSGSRNIGLKVAEHYNKLAVKLNERWHSSVPKKWELAFLPIETVEAKIYFEEMLYCVDFAYANRNLILNSISEAFIEELKGNVHFDPQINIAHNYARWENHFDKNVIVHRKGATSAQLGEVGIIPGSQGTKSYIVEGKGNSESFQSCSHGAGRLMSRTKAQKELRLEAEIARLDSMNIIHAMRSKSDLDEAPSAYKDIDLVMNNQADLVDVKVELTPLAVIKG